MMFILLCRLSPAGKCSYIIKNAGLYKGDPKGYKWATLSEETKQFYWEEFQVNGLLLMLYLVIRHIGHL